MLVMLIVGCVYLVVDRCFFCLVFDVLLKVV